MESNILKMITIADVASMANAVCGLLAIFAIFMGNSILCAQLLILAVIFDSIDGTLARKFNHNPINTIFGENIDSLADVISFGVAPAVILYTLSSSYWIVVPCIIVLLCGVLRLTRYNTMLVEQVGPTKTFVGIPIPVTSFLLSGLLLSSVMNSLIISVLIIIVSILMISEIPYPKIKDMKLIIICGLLCILCLIPGVNEVLYLIPSYLLVVLTIIYIFGTLLYELTGLTNILDLTRIRNKSNDTSKLQSLFKR
ncbi:CDP-diacylglycerol--serine O-phosphatidyltransferase [Methanosphaera sp. WGK6]|uniref:CDP-diacylglycerol--serine O-phosphatidyltransferase n=1 Tax=Methanosphaera sp. WGK6 TaxID=1561964 RepID=UPI00084C8E34|nr:CDP-diacylglycerol--serine O-phosphatidyltransferase [Methanosphaera sp. WGK6]